VQADGKTQPIFAFAALWDSSRTDSGERIESGTV
jgi:hypothetical protein